MNEVENKSNPIKVGLISLGCAKNLVDAEIMLGSLMKGGVQITNDAAQADVVIVNTCSFIDAAQEESIDTILESAELREARHRGQGLIVSGCLPQRFREELPKLLPEVDAFMGIDQVAEVTDIVKTALARRTARLDSAKKAKQPKSTKSRALISGKNDSRQNVTKALADAEKKKAATPPEDESNSLRGTNKFGNTKVMLGLPSLDPGTPLVEVHQRPHFIPDYQTPRFRLTPRHFAYLKIAEGCNHPCSFCIIPRMRGTHRSRPQSDIVQEAKALVADGVREINLISQDSTYYGMDLRPARTGSISSPDKFCAAAKALPANHSTLATLIRDLEKLKGDFWVRLLYTHPAHWTDDLIQAIAESSKVTRYVDMPLQHIHDNMLERMRRETSSQHIVDLIARIRNAIPGIAIRTTFIIGFPGETEGYFQRLVDFVRETRFERMGVFTYSKEDGTRAAGMAGQIPDRIKQQRREILMAEQRKISNQLCSGLVGKTMKVLVEKPATAQDLGSANVSSWENGLLRDGQEDSPISLPKGKYFVARGQADAPDIDGRVYVRGTPPVGEFTRVKIIGYTDYDLIAEPARSS